MESIESLVAAGYRVQLGHTLGTYEDGVEALAQGARGFTHLFNAMTALHHREPGMVGAALAHAQYSEIIPDLLHAHVGAIRVALRAIPCLYCVTDSTAAAGMPDGEYRLGRHKVTKCLGGARRAGSGVPPTRTGRPDLQRLRRVAARAHAELDPHRRARQLGPCGALHGLPDHGPPRSTGHVAADVADHLVPVTNRLRRPGV